MGRVCGLTIIFGHLILLSCRNDCIRCTKKLGLSLVDFNGATCRSRTGVLCMASRYNSHYTNAASLTLEEFLFRIPNNDICVNKICKK